MNAELKLEIAGARGMMLSSITSIQRHADALDSFGAEHQPSYWGLRAAGCSQLLHR